MDCSNIFKEKFTPPHKITKTVRFAEASFNCKKKKNLEFVLLTNQIRIPKLLLKSSGWTVTNLAFKPRALYVVI